MGDTLVFTVGKVIFRTVTNKVKVGDLYISLFSTLDALQERFTELAT
jgi:hypothetical protein